MLRQHKIPVTILTGFLGAGKTTLLNRLLRDVRNQHAGVIINEFGETGIDAELVIKTQEEIIEINKGCICCNVRGDLIQILKDLIVKVNKRDIQLDRIIIETTGLANPGPVIQTFLMDEVMSFWFDIDSVCTVVDAKHLPLHLDQEEAQEQIAFADLIVMNKTDLVSSQEIEDLKFRLKQMNATAEIISTTNSEIPLNKLLGIASFQLSEKLKIRPNMLTDNHHHHDDKINSVVLKADRALLMDRVNEWFSYLVQIKGESLYRYKGILNVKDTDYRVVFQGVHMLFAGTEDRKWKNDETRKSELVFIGSKLNKEDFNKGFRYCMGEDFNLRKEGNFFNV
ncbi:CobW family GTP-binding protein [Oceanobacillus damuensis]|uniref:CobW family GTP-binding protein n=1 Tax=Oceanobacillus damuensis TaxID=937928 RepID=UPI00082955CD|nr:GTP-binding protein [Oceanobacillus damuensis]